MLALEQVLGCTLALGKAVPVHHSHFQERSLSGQFGTPPVNPLPPLPDEDREEARLLADRVQAEELSPRLQRHLSDYEAGHLSGAEWEKRVLQDLRLFYGDLYRFGKQAAGWSGVKLTPQDQAILGRLVRDEAGYLAKFRSDMEQGKGVMPYHARMQLYSNAAWEAWNSGFCMGDLSPERKIRWVYGETEDHCFPEGAKIRMPKGRECSIEQVRTGDLVETEWGPRRVSRLYKRAYTGPLLQVSTTGRKVVCTPNHPFLTQRGWIEARSLVSGQDTVFLENSDDNLSVHVAFPDSFHQVASRLQVGILGSVAALLGLLEGGQRFKSRVPMPPVSVCLKDQVPPDHHVNDELLLDNNGIAKRNLEIVQDCVKALFQLVRSRFLVLLVHRDHKIPRSVMDKTPLGLRCELESHFPGLHLNRRNGISQSLSDWGRAIMGVVLAEVGFFLRSPGPEWIFRSSVAAARLTQIRLAGAAMPAGRAMLQAYNPPFPLLAGEIRVSAPNRAEAPNGPALPVLREDNAAQLTDKLHRNGSLIQSVHTARLADSEPVYNLEIEGAHHYYADGFLVHNCGIQDGGQSLGCSDFEALGWLSAPDFLETVLSRGYAPKSGQLECLGVKCSCWLEESRPGGHSAFTGPPYGISAKQTI